MFFHSLADYQLFHLIINFLSDISLKNLKQMDTNETTIGKKNHIIAIIEFDKNVTYSLEELYKKC